MPNATAEKPVVVANATAEDIMALAMAETATKPVAQADSTSKIWPALPKEPVSKGAFLEKNYPGATKMIEGYNLRISEITRIIVKVSKGTKDHLSEGPLHLAVLSSVSMVALAQFQALEKKFDKENPDN